MLTAAVERNVKFNRQMFDPCFEDVRGFKDQMHIDKIVGAWNFAASNHRVH